MRSPRFAHAGSPTVRPRRRRCSQQPDLLPERPAASKARTRHLLVEMSAQAEVCGHACTIGVKGRKVNGQVLHVHLPALRPSRRRVRQTGMHLTAFLASLGAALGAAVAVVWRIGARADLCTVPPGGITPMCERPGPTALAVVGCALLGDPPPAKPRPSGRRVTRAGVVGAGLVSGAGSVTAGLGRRSGSGGWRGWAPDCARAPGSAPTWSRAWPPVSRAGRRRARSAPGPARRRSRARRRRQVHWPPP